MSFFQSRKTDLCELCLRANKLKLKIIQTDEEKNLITIYKNHVQNAEKQRNSLKLDLKNLLCQNNKRIYVL